MVTRVIYREEAYANAKQGLECIRRRVDAGWILTQVRGPANGPFIVVYRIEEEEA